MFKVKPGLQVAIEEQIDLLRASRIGLVTNQSAVMPDLTHITDALRFAGVTITALFAPEHGIMGAQPDGIDVQSSTDPRTGIPVHSLYSSPCKKPSPEMLFDVDLVVFDIQDVGCRYYTYLSTMAHVIQACAENGKKLIVLDRPNPINGMSVGGNILDPGFSSFIGVYPIPTRHGMTIGELALLFNEEFDIRADIEVIPCYGWNRSMWFDATGLPWVMPSPNMPTIETALLYPGLCLLEGTNLSEGRGTTRPFEIIGAPWIDGYELSDRLNAVGLPGVRFRPTWFAPNTSKFAGVTCGGVQVHVFDRSKGKTPYILTGSLERPYL